MKNIKISIFFASIILTTVYSSEEHRPREHSFNVPPRKHFNAPPRPSFNPTSNKPQQADSPNQQSESNKEISFMNKLNTSVMLWNMAKDIYSLFPSTADQQTIEANKKALEEHNKVVAEQREINTVKKAFYKCCTDHHKASDDQRLDNGLPAICVPVAMNYAALGYPDDVEKAIDFFNKFRK